MNNIFTCNKVSKTYQDNTVAVNVLNSINLTVDEGERIAIIGPSGSGKSTLLHLLGGLDNPTDGELLIEGQAWRGMTEKKRCQLRNQKLGFIYQFHHLLPEFSALENVMLPLILRNESIKSAEQKVQTLLEAVGLKARMSHKPSQLSGGERQRVAIARALISNPKCILADEPTGNLDNATANKVFELMLALNEQANTALIMVTHDKRLAERMDKVLTIENGYLL